LMFSPSLSLSLPLLDLTIIETATLGDIEVDLAVATTLR
jgi:hypothetical protein